jgi:hypothetical protein
LFTTTIDERLLAIGVVKVTIRGRTKTWGSRFAENESGQRLPGCGENVLEGFDVPTSQIFCRAIRALLLAAIFGSDGGMVSIQLQAAVGSWELLSFESILLEPWDRQSS